MTFSSLLLITIMENPISLQHFDWTIFEEVIALFDLCLSSDCCFNELPL